MAITAAMVKELREKSGAGMMECKKALNETNGNLEEAVEFLRKNGQIKAEKKGNRIAAEGLCYVASNGTKEASIVEVNSETDFVANNEKFQSYVQSVADQALSSNAKDLDTFLNEKWSLDNAKTVSEALIEEISVIGEKLSIRRFKKLTASDGLVVSYVHGNGRIAVLLSAKCSNITNNVEEALKNIAMQIAAMNPKYLSINDMDQSYIDHETEILRAQIENDPKEKNKPDHVKEGMIKGRLNKEFKEVCLLDQVYVKAEDGKQSVKAYISEVAKKENTELSLIEFVRFETGEGIEKKQENFAEEVQKQMNN